YAGTHGGWNNSDVTASYTAGDGPSGLDAGSPPGGSFVFSAEGANQSRAAVTVTDAAGNVSAPSESFAGINVDTVAPVLSAGINSPAGTGWYNQSTGPAVVTYSASDATSGVTTPAPHVVFGQGANQSLVAV